MIDKTFTIKKNAADQIDKNDDINYWLQKTVEERFSAVEELRKEQWGEDYAERTEFPKIYKIIKHSN